MEDAIKLPDQLLLAASQFEGGRIALVIGAGSSFESPTCLPLSRELSLETHRKLVQDGVIKEDECSDPSDLSCLAEVVWKKTNSQRAMVDRFPIDQFKQAQPNEGHLLAAALLYERVLNCVITLNFDLAQSNALAQIGTRGNVVEICGPEDHPRLGLTNLIYLHRNVNADPDKWVLRSVISDENWATGWEKVVAEKMISTPVTVFVGLGIPVGVIEHSASLILNKLDGLVQVYQVDPLRKEDSVFFKKLGLPDESYFQMTWIQFMREISQRLLEEQRADLQKACDQLIEQEGWDDPGAKEMSNRFVYLGLIDIGKIRARWTLKADSYSPRRDVASIYLADLLLAIAIIERQTDSKAVFDPEGGVEFRKGTTGLGKILLAHGLGIVSWNSMEAKLIHSPQFSRNDYNRSITAVISGVNGGKPTSISPPENIVYQGKVNSLVPNISRLNMITIDNIRQYPESATKIFHE